MAIGDFFNVPLPWPTDPVPSTADYKAAGVALSIDVSNTPSTEQKARIDSVMGLLSARIERFASAAPVAVKREAARRLHGYHARSSTGEMVSMDIDGLKEVHQHDHSRAFRLSGALGVLSPYRVRLAVPTWEED